MYKSSFHEGNCSLCGSKEEVMTLGFPDTNIKDKSAMKDWFANE